MPAITPNRSANPHASVAVSVWNTVHPKGKRLTLQVNGEIRQDPGEDRYLTPWAEAAVYLRNKNKIAIASRHTGHTVFKAFCKIKATPRYDPQHPARLRWQQIQNDWYKVQATRFPRSRSVPIPLRMGGGIKVPPLNRSSDGI